jgi:hypothetical protein
MKTVSSEYLCSVFILLRSLRWLSALGGHGVVVPSSASRSVALELVIGVASFKDYLGKCTRASTVGARLHWGRAACVALFAGGTFAWFGGLHS